MPWTFAEFHHGFVAPVLEDLLNQLKGLDKEEAAFAKLATADQRGDEARGVIFFNPDVPTTPPSLPPEGTWTMELFQTVDNFNLIYEQVRNRLNTLSMEQAFYAKIVYSDPENGAAAIAIYWLT